MFAAWGDESGSVASVDPGVYVMGAVLVLPEAADDLRAAMLDLRQPAEKKIHWHADDAGRRDKVVGVIAGLPLEGVVVVRHGPREEKDERRRRKCFETFAPELAAAGCASLVLESRGHKADQRDHAMLSALRASRRIDARMRLDHAPGPTDPLLWVADAMCGALVAHRVGEGRWWSALDRRMTLHVVDDAPRA